MSSSRSACGMLRIKATLLACLDVVDTDRGAGDQGDHQIPAEEQLRLEAGLLRVVPYWPSHNPSSALDRLVTRPAALGCPSSRSMAPCPIGAAALDREELEQPQGCRPRGPSAKVPAGAPSGRSFPDRGRLHRGMPAALPSFSAAQMRLQRGNRRRPVSFRELCAALDFRLELLVVRRVARLGVLAAGGLEKGWFHAAWAGRS